MSTIICKNCQHHFKGNFCPHCGQSAKVEAIGVKYFLHDIPHSVFHIDKGFAYTFKELLLRPGKTLREYLDGKRVKHFKPFAYVLLMATLYILATNFLHIITIAIGKQYGLKVTFNETLFYKKYLGIFFFIMIPFVSVTTWLVLIKEKYNYWEHFLVNTYITAQLSVLLFIIEIYKCITTLIFKGSLNFTYFWFITGFMFYIAFVFKNIILPKKGERLRYILKFALLCFLLAFVYITGMSLAGIMTPWWGK
jgi:hypothetical protein